MADFNKLGEKRARRLLIPANCLPCLEKYLLCQILGISNIAYPIVDVPVHPINVHIVEPPKGIGIATYSLIHQQINIRCCFGIFASLQLVFHFV